MNTIDFFIFLSAYCTPVTATSAYPTRYPSEVAEQMGARKQACILDFVDCFGTPSRYSLEIKEVTTCIKKVRP